MRRAGEGRTSIEETHPEIVGVLESLVGPVTRADPESPLRWTSKSTRKLAEELSGQGFKVSPQKVGQLLHASGYSLQSEATWVMSNNLFPIRSLDLRIPDPTSRATHSVIERSPQLLLPPSQLDWRSARSSHRGSSPASYVTITRFHGHRFCGRTQKKNRVHCLAARATLSRLSASQFGGGCAQRPPMQSICGLQQSLCTLHTSNSPLQPPGGGMH